MRCENICDDLSCVKTPSIQNIPGRSVAVLCILCIFSSSWDLSTSFENCGASRAVWSGVVCATTSVPVCSCLILFRTAVPETRCSLWLAFRASAEPNTSVRVNRKWLQRERLIEGLIGPVLERQSYLHNAWCPTHWRKLTVKMLYKRHLSPFSFFSMLLIAGFFSWIAGGKTFFFQLWNLSFLLSLQCLWSFCKHVKCSIKNWSLGLWAAGWNLSTTDIQLLLHSFFSCREGL